MPGAPLYLNGLVVLTSWAENDRKERNTQTPFNIKKTRPVDKESCRMNVWGGNLI